MSENEKKELNENELEKAAGGSVRMDDLPCEDFQEESKSVSVPESYRRCTNCIHYKMKRPYSRSGTCDLGH